MGTKVCYDGQEEIKYCTTKSYQVQPETVGQFIGLTDKNGNKIFESDIVKCHSLEYGYTNKTVYYSEDKARFVLSSLGTDYGFEEYITLKVIGNIYDNEVKYCEQ